MALLSDIIARVRTELGDNAQDFVIPVPGGRAAIDLGVANVIAAGITVTVSMPGMAGVVVDPSRYTLAASSGIIVLLDVPDELATVTVVGSYYPLFTDVELTQFITDAAIHHFHGRELTVRSRDEAYGFIKYTRTPVTIANCAEVELLPLAMLATIEALWTLATDAASDIDVVTAEGTHISRGQRYEQIMGHIVQLTNRYTQWCQQYNIGLFRIETSQLRRVSLTTGRLVPLFRPREYDEQGPESWPKRQLPQIDSRDEDESGIPSPWAPGWGY